MKPDKKFAYIPFDADVRIYDDKKQRIGLKDMKKGSSHSSFLKIKGALRNPPTQEVSLCFEIIITKCQVSEEEDIWELLKNSVDVWSEFFCCGTEWSILAGTRSGDALLWTLIFDRRVTALPGEVGKVGRDVLAGRECISARSPYLADGNDWLMKK